MKNERTETPQSQWETLPWKKVNVNSSNNEDDDIDDSKFLNSKNHYDDPNADSTELYGGGTSKKKKKVIVDNSTVEGADDPGIFLGLEVIDGSQYQVEKVKVGMGTNEGYITRLIISGDKNREEEQDHLNNKGKQTVKKEAKRKEKNETKQVVKKKSNDLVDSVETELKPKVDEKKQLSSKEKKKLRFEEMLAKRKEKKLQKKRKRKEVSSESDPENDGNDQPVNTAKVSKKQKSKSNNESTLGEIEHTTRLVNQEDISRIQSSWAIGTGGVYFHEKICASLHQLQFESPTPIQASTLAASILGQRDVVGAAPTGSGKTLSYLLPILQYLLSIEDKEISIAQPPPKSKLTALILCPTRELALQVSNEYSKLVSSTVNEPYYKRIKCGSIVGGLSEQKQKRVINEKRPPLLVGTPGRLWDLVSRVFTA